MSILNTLSFVSFWLKTTSRCSEAAVFTFVSIVNFVVAVVVKLRAYPND